MKIHPTTLPDTALLARYQKTDFTDCYRTTIDIGVTFEHFVEAFYTTRLFKLERWILSVALKKPSTDLQAKALAEGTSENWAAWTVEARTENQLLLCDIAGQTRSWLMSSPDETAEGQQTDLWFGSAVIHNKTAADGTPLMGFGFRLLMRFHHWYSIALLKAAARRLAKQSPA
ncbi:MAG: hypothetical protein AB8F65_14145 [Woeseiaceae bacterium]